MSRTSRPRTGAYVRTSPWLAGAAAVIFLGLLLLRLTGPTVDDSVAGAIGYGIGWGLLPGFLVAIAAHAVLWYAVLKRARVDGTSYLFGMWGIVFVCNIAANVVSALLAGAH